jgi:4-alpha-glucanotransferase
MTSIEALARRCGIALTQRDARGERPVSRETLQIILAALGHDAGSDERAAEALAALDRRELQAVLPPVVAARAPEAAVEVSLPQATRIVSWHLLCEDGTQRTGEAAFADLPLAARSDARDSRPASRNERRRLSLGILPAGYHRLSIEPLGASCLVVVTPARCFLPSIDETSGFWGVALQLYLARSQRNFGSGDFGDLAALTGELARRGCDVVGLNPLHAPFPDDPEHASPYSPASRLLLNPMYIDVEAACETVGSRAASEMLADSAVTAELAALRAADTLEYGRVAALKSRVLERAFADWRRAGATRELDAFRASRGAAFERHCWYFALRAHVLAEGLGSGDWHGWPEQYRDSRSPAVAEFARSHADEVTRVAWQQWLADRQLEAAAKAAGAMRIGLYRDLAVGCDAAGAETWADRDFVMEGLAVGAPPDELSASGQEWGLPPPHPERMRASGYRTFAELLRANMRHAGALRIDHVMALERLYVIPKGASPKEGAYLKYPFADLVGVLALESERHRCLVIGEDLGTVPEGFRERAAAASILSYRVLRFERDAHRFFAPSEYPRLAVAVCSNHDLPTLSGWWQGADLTLEHEHGVLSAEDLAGARQRRDADRSALLELLHREQLLPFWVADPTYEELFGAVHALLGRTRALLVLAQLDDVLREHRPVNVPSTPQYPNWRRRYGTSVEELGSEPLLAAVAAAFGARRSRAGEPAAS